MRLSRRGDLLIVRDAPGCWWFTGGLFGGVGGLFALGPLGLFSDSAEMSLFQRLAALAMGTIGVGVGVWFLHAAPLSTAIFDRRAGQARLRRRWLLGRTEHPIPLASLWGVRLVRQIDGDGDSVYRVVLALDRGIEEPLSPVWSHDRAGCERVALAVRDFLGLDEPSAHGGALTKP